MRINQQTISKNLSFSGVGLHSGKPVNIELYPSPPNSGIYFSYLNKKIKASWRNAEVSQLCTKIKNKKTILFTIEHLLSALSGLGISNILIKTSSNEMPILDGSSKDFVEQILSAGIEDQKIKQKFIKINKRIKYSEKDKFIKIEPLKDNKLIINYTIDYKDKFIKKQSYIYEHDYENYKQIYLARTFCFYEDLEKIFAMGLAKGGSLDNAIVVSDNKILNQGGLRYDNEFVKHKILDCVGDLYLAEHQICGSVNCFGGGHELNLMLLREIFKDSNNYSIIE